MENFWLWLITVVFFSSIVIIITAYYQCMSVLNPKRRTPISVFPDQFRLAFERAVMQTSDGITIKGWFIPAQAESSKTIILMHGWGNNRGDTLLNTHFLSELGFNLLYFDFRASGESGGTFSSVGYLELRDFDAAMEYLRERKPECAQSIGVYGISLGASVAVYQAAKRPEIKCIAIEAPFDSYQKVVGRWSWINMKIPWFPFVPLALLMVRAKLGIDPEPFSPFYNIDKVSPRPILLIHGSHDNLVFPKDAKRLFERAGEPKEMWLVPGAVHGKCAEVGGEEYKKRMGEFFAKHL